MEMAQGFLIHGNHLALGDVRHGLNPIQKVSLELFRIQAGEDAAKGVVGGDTVGQLQKGREPVEFGMAEAFYIHPAVGTADHGADSNDQDIQQLMTFAALNSRVFRVGEMPVKWWR
jgi:hypothetical protein